MNFKFHLVPAHHTKVRYQHELVSICEGLRELGYEFYGSSSYWEEPETGTLLIREAPVGYDAQVQVYNTYFFEAFPEAIREVDYSKINILIDREDGLYGAYGHPQFRRFNAILRTHYSKNIPYAYYNKNIRPWAFGLTNRIMHAIDRSAGQAMQDRVLLNFRIAHDLRGMAVEKMSPVLSGKYAAFNGATADFAPADAALLTPADTVYAKQSGSRHDPVYYQRLDTSILTYAFGGFVLPKPFATNRLVRPLQGGVKLAAALLRKLKQDDSGCYFINQFDSWRLWEALYSRTCPIHLDLEDWSLVLPVMPVSKVHYWGVKRFQFEQSAEELLAMHRDDLQEIGENGRIWSKVHYSPLAVAERFITLVNQLEQ